MAGLRARRLEDTGIVMSSLNGEGPMHRRNKGVPATHDLGQEVGKEEIARRLRLGRRMVDNRLISERSDISPETRAWRLTIAPAAA